MKPSKLARKAQERVKRAKSRRGVRSLLTPHAWTRTRVRRVSRSCPCAHVHVSSGKDAGLDHECELVDCITIVMCGCMTVALPATAETRVCRCVTRTHARAHCSEALRARTWVDRMPSSLGRGLFSRAFCTRNDASNTYAQPCAGSSGMPADVCDCGGYAPLRSALHSSTRHALCTHTRVACTRSRGLRSRARGNKWYCIRRRKAATLPLSFEQLFEAAF